MSEKPIFKNKNESKTADNQPKRYNFAAENRQSVS
jgi:hypothetical protein